MLIDMMNHPDLSFTSHHTLQKIVTGASDVPPELRAKVESAFEALVQVSGIFSIIILVYTGSEYCTFFTFFLFVSVLWIIKLWKYLFAYKC